MSIVSLAKITTNREQKSVSLETKQTKVVVFFLLFFFVFVFFLLYFILFWRGNVGEEI